MIHRLDHALVMDTDDIPGRGGYAVVGLSDGLTASERVFVAENFGISDYLHDPQNDRAFFSFFRVPNGRRAFVRRFPIGRRRNGTQNRVFVHTIFLSEETFHALDGRPSLLTAPQSRFRLAGTSEWQPLRLEYGSLLSDPAFPPLEWEEVDFNVVEYLGNRLTIVGRQLPNVDPRDAVAAAITALQQGKRAMLPQGSAYELITLLAWSMLPYADRASMSWTQHDAQGFNVAFDLANAPSVTSFDTAVDPIARRIVDENLADQHDFHARAAAYGVTVRANAIASWFRWREEFAALLQHLDQPRDVVVAKLRRLAQTVRADQRDPWVNGEEMLQLLRTQPRALDEWAALLHESGLGQHLFAEPPRAEWLDRMAETIAPEALVRFYLEGKPEPRNAVAAWLLERALSPQPGRWETSTSPLSPQPGRGETSTSPLSPPGGERVAEGRVRGVDISPTLLADLIVRTPKHAEPLLEWLLESPDGLDVLANAPKDLTLLATRVAYRREHPQAASFVRTTVLRQLQKPADLSEPDADAIAALLGDHPEDFVRFLQLLDMRLQKRITEAVQVWLSDDRERTLPLARAVVRSANVDHPAITQLVFALAKTGEPASTWGKLMVALATRIEASEHRDRFIHAVQQLHSVDAEGLYDALLPSISSGGRAIEALVEITERAWTEKIVKPVQAALQKNAIAWESIVARVARAFDAQDLLVTFWNRVDQYDVPKLGAAIIPVTRNLEGERAAAFVKRWKPLIRELPKDARADQLIDLIRDLERGETREMRMDLAWRALEHGNATLETLNRLDDDLWQRQPRTYGKDIASALGKFAGAARVERVMRLIEVTASPRVLPTVKLAAEELLPRELALLSLAEWRSVVKSPQLFDRASVLMSIARHAGSSGAHDAAKDFETLARRAQRKDALDALAAGRLDAESNLKRFFKRLVRGR